MRYQVKHAFAHEGVWYSTRNADEVATLPRDIRDPLIAQGKLVEFRDESSETDEGEPFDPDTEF